MSSPVHGHSYVKSSGIKNYYDGLNPERHRRISPTTSPQPARANLQSEYLQNMARSREAVQEKYHTMAMGRGYASIGRFGYGHNGYAGYQGYQDYHGDEVQERRRQNLTDQERERRRQRALSMPRDPVTGRFMSPRRL